MLAAFFRWLTGANSARPVVRSGAGIGAGGDISLPAGHSRGHVYRPIGSSSPPRKPTHYDDHVIRHRLYQSIQEARHTDAMWEQAAVIAELSEESEQRRKEWRREYAYYHSTPEWAEVRIRVLEKARYRCSECGGEAVAVHHLRYPKGYGPALQDFIDNEDESLLVAICNDCHTRIHARSIIARKQVRPMQPAQAYPADDCDDTGSDDWEDGEDTDRLGDYRRARPSRVIPRRPDTFAVAVSSGGQAMCAQAESIGQVAHIVTVAASGHGAPAEYEEYWIRDNGERWIVYRRSTLDVTVSAALSGMWTLIASASKGPETHRAASIYILLAAWKKGLAASRPKVMKAGVCTAADIRWISSQVWPAGKHVGHVEEPAKKAKKKGKGKKRQS
jgi:hypothetical protein